MATWQLILTVLAGVAVLAAAVLGFLQSKSDAVSDRRWKEAQTELAQRALARAGDTDSILEIVKEQALEIGDRLPVDPEKFAHDLVSSLDGRVRSLDALADLSDRELAKYNLRWGAIYLFSQRLVIDHVAALNESGIDVALSEADPLPEMFQSRKTLASGQTYRVVSADFGEFAMQLCIVPGEIIDGDLRRHARLTVQAGLDTGAKEGFFSLLVSDKGTTVTSKPDPISSEVENARYGSEASEEDIAEISSLLDRSIKAAITYCVARTGAGREQE